MDNIFMSGLPPQTHSEFAWANLGDIKEGRGDLGEEMPVLVYRMMQYTMMDVLSKEFGIDGANKYFYKAGYLAGSEFAKNELDLTVDFDTFVSNLREALKELKVAIMRMENYDPTTGNMTLTMGQDLDCSGLPVTNENVCVYDEGFLAGILEVYTGKPYNVQEVDCWASGDRVCRFRGTVKKDVDPIL